MSQTSVQLRTEKQRIYKLEREVKKLTGIVIKMKGWIDRKEEGDRIFREQYDF